jgi:hypothetical protein
LDFIENPVLTDALGAQAEDLVDPLVDCLGGEVGRLAVDEYVRVGGVRPASGSVVEVGGQSGAGLAREEDDVAVEV